jgi:hypothetical protein
MRNLFVKIAELFTRQEQLKAELNEILVDPSEQSTNASEDQMIQQREGSEPQTGNLVEIDTAALGKKVNNLRLRLGMPMKSLAEKINLSEYYLHHLFKNPDPWCMLNNRTKVQYSKIEAWYVMNKHAVKPKASERKNNKKRSTFGDVRRPLVNTDISLDTVEVSMRVEDMLRMHGIDFACFAQWKLYVSKDYFFQLLCQPKEWATLSESDKRTYVRMQTWSLATQEEIVALKETLTDRLRFYKAKKATKILKLKKKTRKL